MKSIKQKVVLCLIVCFSMLLVFMCGCSSSSEESTQNNSATTNSTTQEASAATTDTPAPKSNELAIGEISIVDDFECSIKEVNWYSASDFDFDVITKEDGFEYIVLVLSEKNTTSETKNAPMVNILSADGTQCTNAAALSLYKKQYKINFGATMPDTTAEAYMIYKIPAGAQSFKLQILSNGFGSSSEYFVFDRSEIQ